MSDTPALNIPIRATGLDTFKSQMNETTILAANATRAVAATTIKMSAGFLASQGAAGAATLAFGRLLGFLRPIALGVTAVYDTFEFLKKSVELAGQQIEAFNAIAAKANSAGVGTDFYQRFTKSAPKAVLSIDQVTEALQNFNNASTERLGGSDVQQRIDELTKAGNFKGNAGLGQLAGSSTTEERLRAIVSLIDQAMQKGERLAALDIAGKAFGAPVTAALRADSGFLDQMLQRADAMSKAQIISQDDIGRAIELKDRMEAAQQILADKWVPIQRDMAQLGMNAKANWASVVEVFAQLVDLGDKLYATLKQIPDVFARIGNAPIWKKIVDATTTPEGRAAAEAAAGGSSDPKVIFMQDARDRVAAALRNPGDMQRAMQTATTVQTAMRGDLSKNPDKPASSDTTDAVDRAINSLRKHTQEQEADTKAIGLGDAALARFKAQAQETAAVQANHGKETAEQAAAFKTLQERAGAAAEALAKAKLADQISFSNQTAFLTENDVQIATQLKSIYGSDVPRALASTEAEALRAANTLKQLGSAFSSSINQPLLDLETGTKSATSSLQSFAASFSRALLSMANQALIVKPLLSGFGNLFGLPGGSLGGGTGLSATGTGGLYADGGFISGPGTATSDSIPARLSNGEFVVRASATAKHRDLLEAINSNRVPKFADGGLVGGGTGSGPLMGSAGGGHSVTFGDININGGAPGTTNAQHREFAKAIQGQLREMAGQMIGDELRKQTRPGGVLRR